jgi:hypothetical protein
MALAAGRSRLRIGAPTMHTRTAVVVAASLTGAPFRFRPCAAAASDDPGTDPGVGWAAFPGAGGGADAAAAAATAAATGLDGPILLECDGIGYGAS